MKPIYKRGWQQEAKETKKRSVNVNGVRRSVQDADGDRWKVG
jgi:hypothetical protein